MQIIAGQNVSPNSMPGPTGFGFGSGHNPNAAAVMMNNSGVAPTTSKTRPTLTHVDLRYWLMADCGLTVKLSGRPTRPDQRPGAHCLPAPAAPNHLRITAAPTIVSIPSAELAFKMHLREPQYR